MITLKEIQAATDEDTGLARTRAAMGKLHRQRNSPKLHRAHDHKTGLNQECNKLFTDEQGLVLWGKCIVMPKQLWGREVRSGREENEAEDQILVPRNGHHGGGKGEAMSFVSGQEWVSRACPHYYQ